MAVRKKIKNLSCCGGGVYGFAELAALKEIEKYSEYLDIQNIKGVSVGSIVAAFYAIGYSVDELTKIIFDLDLEKLIKDTYFTTIHLYNYYGMHKSKGLEDEIERLISMKTNIKLCTFSQIEKNLTIIATNLNYQCPKFFNRENTPDVPISQAIRCSIAFPFIMTPVLFEGDYYCDGGAYMNYPITTFDDDELDETIGITFSSYNENNDGTLHTRCEIKDVYDYFASVGQTMTRSAYVSQITEKYLKRSIVVKISEKITSMQFHLTKEQKEFIYQCGIISAREQIAKILNVEPIVEEEPIKLELIKLETLDQAEIEEAQLVDKTEIINQAGIILNTLALEPLIQAKLTSQVDTANDSNQDDTINEINQVDTTNDSNQLDTINETNKTELVSA